MRPAAVTARYIGWCAICRDKVTPGDPIVPVFRSGPRWACERCAEVRGELDRIAEVYRRDRVEVPK